MAISVSLLLKALFYDEAILLWRTKDLFSSKKLDLKPNLNDGGD
jgi:hypothetical protein